MVIKHKQQAIHVNKNNECYFYIASLSTSGVSYRREELRLMEGEKEKKFVVPVSSSNGKTLLISLLLPVLGLQQLKGSLKLNYTRVLVHEIGQAASWGLTGYLSPRPHFQRQPP